jgi:hypothetical protein
MAAAVAPAASLPGVFFIRFFADRANARPAPPKHLILKGLIFSKRANARSP